MHRRLVDLALFILALAVLTACKDAGGGSSKVTVAHSKVPEATFEVKAGNTYASTKTFTRPDGKGGFEKNVARIVTVFLSNQPFEPGGGMARLRRAPESADETKVQFGLVGKDGTKGEQPNDAPELGTYSTSADRFMRLEATGILAHDGTKGAKHWLTSSKATGTVEIKSAADGKIEGSIKVQDGDAKIEGSFVANLGPGPKKK